MFHYKWKTGYDMPEHYCVNKTKSGEGWYFQANLQPREMQKHLLYFEEAMEKMGKRYTLADFNRVIDGLNQECKNPDCLIKFEPISVEHPVQGSFVECPDYIDLNGIAFDESRYKIMAVGYMLGEVLLKRCQTFESLVKKIEADADQWAEVDKHEHEKWIYADKLNTIIEKEKLPEKNLSPKQ